MMLFGGGTKDEGLVKDAKRSCQGKRTTERCGVKTVQSENDPIELILLWVFYYCCKFSKEI